MQSPEYIELLFQKHINGTDKITDYTTGIYDYLADKGIIKNTPKEKTEAYKRAKVQIGNMLCAEYIYLTDSAKRLENRDQLYQLDWVKVPEPLHSKLVELSKLSLLTDFFDHKISEGKTKIFEK